MQTLYGAATMLRETGQHPTVLREQVSSPGGTTVAALRQLDDHKVRAAFVTAMEAAAAPLAGAGVGPGLSPWAHGTDPAAPRRTPDDWEAHRDIRLAMLQDAPDAFWFTYADEAAFDEARLARADRGRLARAGPRLDGRPRQRRARLALGARARPTTATLVRHVRRAPGRGPGVGEALVPRGARRGAATRQATGSSSRWPTTTRRPRRSTSGAGSSHRAVHDRPHARDLQRDRDGAPL